MALLSPGYPLQQEGSVFTRPGAFHRLLLSSTRSELVFRTDIRKHVGICARDSPEIHGGVGAPRPPGFRPTLQLLRAVQGQGTEEAEITRGKSVRFPERPHRYILCRPFSDPGNFTEAVQKRI